LKFGVHGEVGVHVLGASRDLLDWDA
jgi:hypothetical protein